jgi:hypothetical protein
MSWFTVVIYSCIQPDVAPVGRVRIHFASPTVLCVFNDSRTEEEIVIHCYSNTHLSSYLGQATLTTLLTKNYVPFVPNLNQS